MDVEIYVNESDDEEGLIIDVVDSGRDVIATETIWYDDFVDKIADRVDGGELGKYGWLVVDADRQDRVFATESDVLSEAIEEIKNEYPDEVKISKVSFLGLIY